MYGRTTSRWTDHKIAWQHSQKALRVVIRNKLRMILKCRHAFGMYATVEEDLLLRKDDTWQAIFPKTERHRVYFHDSTNIPLQDPSDPDLYRSLRNEYYGMCCGKGGVAIQQCGWIRTFPLMTGAMGDSEYIVKARVLEKQKRFSMNDLSSPQGAINVMDKGYRTTLMAQAMGQTNMQPAFSVTDQKFNARETLYSAAIAALRSGNERAVHSVKQSWLLTKNAAAISKNPDLKYLSDVWLAFGFQVNFMYCSVH